MHCPAESSPLAYAYVRVARGASMDTALDSARQNLWQHLTSDRQAWLLGAGISFAANIPLMYGLTAYVEVLVKEANADEAELLLAIKGQLPEDCHIEHVLSQLGDLIAIADRSRTKSVALGSRTVAVDELRELHASVIDKIGYAVRYGYRQAQSEQVEVRGTPGNPIVEVDGHRAFVRRLFAARREPGLGSAPVAFFTTNYDTLIEDALALEQVRFVDGFLGGAMAYWSPEIAYADATASRARAKVVKLHGSVDWHVVDDGRVVRCRDGCAYPHKVGNLLIYPQSTKYVATQKDPFASLFAQLRSTLAMGPDNVLGICGYSFGDDHINGEIESAMRHPGSKTVVVAFAEERERDGVHRLPERLEAWLQDPAWGERVFVASSRGLYHGNLTNLCPGSSPGWWTFQGLTDYLAEGPEYLAAAPACEVPVPTPEVLAEAAE